MDGFAPELRDRWFPVLRAPEAEKRHVARTQLLGEEIALWRDDDGLVNAWANQCPHRGVRLSIGSNFGNRLKCRYHGWEFASGTAQCTAIPAHPGLVPGKQYRARAFATAEQGGYVWVNLGGNRQASPLDRPDSGEFMTQRSVLVRSSAARVADHLATSDEFALRAEDAFDLAGDTREGGIPIRIMLQPMDHALTAIHMLAKTGGDPAVRHLCNQILVEARAAIEARR